MIEYRLYDDITQQYATSGQKETEKLCNSILITNIGGDPVFVNNKLLLPGVSGQLSTTSGILGDSFSLGGNEGEVYAKRTIVVAFAGTAANPLIEVTQKYYQQQ